MRRIHGTVTIKFRFGKRLSQRSLSPATHSVLAIPCILLQCSSHVVFSCLLDIVGDRELIHQPLRRHIPFSGGSDH